MSQDVPQFAGLVAAARYLGMSYLAARQHASKGALVTDPHGLPIVRVFRVGGLWKVPTAELAEAAGVDVAVLAEWLREFKPEHGPGSGRGRAPSPRSLAIVEEYRSSRSMDQVAATYGITRQRVQQIVAKIDPDATEDRRRYRREERAANDLWHRTRLCRVCGEWFVGTRQQTECSDPCRHAWRIGRRYFDRKFYEQHRRYIGAPAAPNRRYTQPGSAVRRALEAVGRTDLLPPGGRKPPETSPCSAVNLNGTACNRKVPVGVELCHIHAAAAERAAS